MPVTKTDLGAQKIALYEFTSGKDMALRLTRGNGSSVVSVALFEGFDERGSIVIPLTDLKEMVKYLEGA